MDDPSFRIIIDQNGSSITITSDDGDLIEATVFNLLGQSIRILKGQAKVTTEALAGQVLILAIRSGQRELFRKIVIPKE
jgi:hypothetical protein